MKNVSSFGLVCQILFNKTVKRSFSVAVPPRTDLKNFIYLVLHIYPASSMLPSVFNVQLQYMLQRSALECSFYFAAAIR